MLYWVRVNTFCSQSLVNQSRLLKPSSSLNFAKAAVYKQVFLLTTLPSSLHCQNSRQQLSRHQLQSPLLKLINCSTSKYLNSSLLSLSVPCNFRSLKMTDSGGPPKLDQISQSSEFNVPTMSSMNSDSVQDTKQGLYSS